MIPYDLYRLLQCPTCGSRDLIVHEAGVRCAACRNDYPRHDGYLDLMPRSVEFGYVSKYVSEEQELAEELDYHELAPPLLAAGVRDRALARLLDFQPTDIALDSGCGTAKHAVWNADRVRLMVGADPATMFADAAVERIALTKADARRLPFADGSFDKAFSIDVLEHFPRDVIDAYLAETARVLQPGGRLLVFSNTSDPSSLQPLVNVSRQLGRLFVRAGLYDFQRQARRKSDHIKALRTWEHVLDAMAQAGLRPVKVVFWNSVFTTFVEHVLMKLGEAVLGRSKNNEQNTEAPEARTENQKSQTERRSSPVLSTFERTSGEAAAATQDAELNTMPLSPSLPLRVNSVKSQSSSGTDREIRARRRMRVRLEQRGPTYYALMAVTLVMELDLWLFGGLRSGSYFIVVEKP